MCWWVSVTVTVGGCRMYQSTVHNHSPVDGRRVSHRLTDPPGLSDIFSFSSFVVSIMDRVPVWSPSPTLKTQSLITANVTVMLARLYM